MVQALAPRLSPLCLAVALLASCPTVSLAQADAGKDAAKKDAPAAKADADKDDDNEKVGIIDKKEVEKQENFEVFEDPRAKPLLKNTFKELPPQRSPLTNGERSALRNQAAGVVGVNRDLIIRVIDQSAADLTKHANIKAVIDPDPGMPPGDARTRAIEGASQFLMELLNTAQDKKNEAFLREYTTQLFARLTPLLEGHLLSRVQASIILASAATPAQVDLFIKMIEDPRQVAWVKHWAAQGLTRAAGRGKVTLEINKATAAAVALLGFLDKEPTTPWPVKLRVFEALGSIRLASTAGATGKPDVAGLAMQVMCDPAVRIDVRAWGAWTLGMLTIPASNANFNVQLEAYQVGRLAAEIGDKIVADCDQRKEKSAKPGQNEYARFTKAGQNDYARYLTGLLIYQVYAALAGMDDVANSGLLNSRHPAALAARPFLSGLDEQIKNVGRAANDLLNAGGNQVKAARDDLAARVVELKSFLDKNRPASGELFPGGPKIPLNPQQVPRAPAARAK